MNAALKDGLTAARSRFDDVNRRYAESREALYAWVEGERRALEEAEADSLAKDEAIDAESCVLPMPFAAVQAARDPELERLTRELEGMLAQAHRAELSAGSLPTETARFNAGKSLHR